MKFNSSPNLLHLFDLYHEVILQSNSKQYVSWILFHRRNSHMN